MPTRMPSAKAILLPLDPCLSMMYIAVPRLAKMARKASWTRYFMPGIIQ